MQRMLELLAPGPARFSRDAVPRGIAAHEEVTSGNRDHWWEDIFDRASAIGREAELGEARRKNRDVGVWQGFDSSPPYSWGSGDWTGGKGLMKQRTRQCSA